MSEATTPTATGVNLATIVREYITSLQTQPTDGTTPNQFDAEQRFLERACVLLETVRKAGDNATEAYLKNVIQEHLGKGQAYTTAYQQAQKTLEGAVEEEKVEENDKDKGRKKHSYPEIIASEVSEVITRYETAQPKDTFSEREIIIILKHYDNLPSSYSYFIKLKYSGIFERVSTRRNMGSLYTAESIKRFLTTINDLVYLNDKERHNLAREFQILSWQVSKLIEHESVGRYFSNLFDLLDIKYHTLIIVYKPEDYNAIVAAMRKLVDGKYLSGVKEAIRSKAIKDDTATGRKAKQTNAPKPDGNGNGTLLDFSGIEQHLGLAKGTIVGKPIQDRVERLLGDPEMPEKGDPGYPTPKVERLKSKILALVKNH